MTKLIFYYIFASSLIFYYGVGINRLLSLKRGVKTYLLSLSKTLFLTVLTTSFSYLLNFFVLKRLSAEVLMPLFMCIIFVALSFLFNFLIKAESFELGEDYVLPFMIVLMSLTESFSFVSALFISLASTASFYLLVLFVFALKKRFDLYKNGNELKSFNVLIFSIAVLLIIFYCSDVSFLNFILK
ncbi:hypothetical protein [Treponema pectinovorum]|uniref:hypothetical protein n=1 Tax=Treponema pectinovorum TaxID=164 RepID=UPI0011F15D40|nr:hypothetical protein [Treponema pectinovorum]